MRFAALLLLLAFCIGLTSGAFSALIYKELIYGHDRNGQCDCTVCPSSETSAASSELMLEAEMSNNELPEGMPPTDWKIFA